MDWDDRRKQIVREADLLLKAVWKGEVPVPVERIARSLKCEIRYAPHEGEISGMLSRETDRVIIGVNSLQNIFRQRFTIAHELGHLVLHPDLNIVVDRRFESLKIVGLAERKGRSAETEADLFATSLLMPSSILRKGLHGKSLDIEQDNSLQDLADRFQVSLQVLIFRLVGEGILAAGL